MSRPTRTGYLIAVASVSVLLTACGAETGTETGGGAADSPAPIEAEIITPERPTMTDDARPTSIPAPTPDDSLPSGPVDASVLEREEVKAAITAEAERRQVSEDEVEVIGFADVTWTDGSLGCPQPGMHYTQALVPGYQLILQVGGERASYHSGKDKLFRYCANPMTPAPGGAGGTSTS
ncbi:hypothetical protein [Ornithinimicrobium pratense]|uniref:LppP/LprE family lipoprotein n=1 Tax=Ornithinimicrobium pratense TaxID=2593973 RepID=A0A5J6V6R6_9MICO|nr:hypothetical protein [Ornithinimicrobium pratense]QFG69710.1 hypothetical protein FY030_14270 [Ornithinimicrobium pratense]